MNEYYVYIVTNRKHILYIGVTNDLQRRISEHQDGEPSSFIQKSHLGRLVYFEAFEDVRDAIAREKQLKGWTREKKLKLIESMNLKWSDLGRDL